MLAIVYPRVSTEEQARSGYSLATQREACWARARQLGYTDERIMEVSDDGVSGEILERPGLTRVRELVRQGGVGHFVCLDPDRFSRKLTHQLLLTEEMERAGVQLEFINFEWKDTAEGRLFYSLRGAIAEYEKEKIKERTMRGKRQKAKEGKLPQNPRIYGYAYDKESDSLTIDNTAAEWVRQMYAWCVREGMGGAAIARRLNELGVTPPRAKHWCQSSVRGILGNPTYLGVLHIFKSDTRGMKANRYRPSEQRVRRKQRPPQEWHPVNVPQIVDEFTWHKAAAVLEQLRRVRPGRHAPYLLTGLCVCGVCGRPMNGCSNYIRGERYRYYRCYDGKGECDLPYMPADKLEEQVWEVVNGWITNPSVYRAVLKSASSHDEARDSKAELVRVTSRLAEIAEERDRLMLLFQKGLVPLDKVEANLAELVTQETKLRLSISHLEEKAQAHAVPPLKDLRSIADAIRKGLGDDPNQEQKSYALHQMLSAVVINADGSVTLHANIPLQVPVSIIQ